MNVVVACPHQQRLQYLSAFLQLEGCCTLLAHPAAVMGRSPKIGDAVPGETVKRTQVRFWVRFRVRFFEIKSITRRSFTREALHRGAIAAVVAAGNASTPARGAEKGGEVPTLSRPVPGEAA